MYANYEAPEAPPMFHHVAVQTADFDGCVAWYQEFFDGRVVWTLEDFSELTRSRLPGIGKLAELSVGDIRFHIFNRGADLDQPPPPDTQQFQHLCLSTGSAAEIATWRARWMALYRSGRYRYAVSEEATEIVTDDDGVQSFYCHDVNGLEYEFTYVPASDR